MEAEHSTKTLPTRLSQIRQNRLPGVEETGAEGSGERTAGLAGVLREAKKKPQAAFVLSLSNCEKKIASLTPVPPTGAP